LDGAEVVALEELMEIDWSVWSENREVTLFFAVVHKTKKRRNHSIRQSIFPFWLGITYIDILESVKICQWFC